MAQACTPRTQLKIWLSSTAETFWQILSAMTIMKNLHRNSDTVFLQRKIWMIYSLKQAFKHLTSNHCFLQLGQLITSAGRFQHSLGQEGCFRKPLTEAYQLCSHCCPCNGYSKDVSQAHRRSSGVQLTCQTKLPNLRQDLGYFRAPFPKPAKQSKTLLWEWKNI